MSNLIMALPSMHRIHLIHRILCHDIQAIYVIVRDSKQDLAFVDYKLPLST
jgi:hypothetical protein